MPASFVQKSLRIIALFEAYNSDLPLEQWIRLVRIAKVEPEEAIRLASIAAAQKGKPQIVEEETPELVELFPEAEKRKFPFFDRLDKVGMKDLARQSSEIARQLRSGSKR